MRKILTLLLLVSTVIGMVVPAMAIDFQNENTAKGGDNDAHVNTDTEAANVAVNSISQDLDIGDQVNVIAGSAEGGNAIAASDAKSKEKTDVDTDTKNKVESGDGGNGESEAAGIGIGAAKACNKEENKECNDDEAMRNLQADEPNDQTSAAVGVGVGVSENEFSGNGGSSVALGGVDSDVGVTGGDSTATSDAMATAGNPTGILADDITQGNTNDQTADATINNDQSITQDVNVIVPQFAIAHADGGDQEIEHAILADENELEVELGGVPAT